MRHGWAAQTTESDDGLRCADVEAFGCADVEAFGFQAVTVREIHEVSCRQYNSVGLRCANWVSSGYGVPLVVGNDRGIDRPVESYWEK